VEKWPVTTTTAIATTIPIPVAVRSQTWVCGRSPAGIAGSNPAGGIDVMCWQVEVSAKGR
jgi:hypothetical protein